jgi:hypothetical protein
MKTNPEEFLAISKWTYLISKYDAVLTKEEKAQLNSGMRAILMPMFERDVLSELMGDKKGGVVNYQERMRINLDGGIGIGATRPSQQLTLSLLPKEDK